MLAANSASLTKIPLGVEGAAAAFNLANTSSSLERSDTPPPPGETNAISGAFAALSFTSIGWYPVDLIIGCRFLSKSAIIEMF